MDFKDLMVGDLVYVVRGYDKHLTIEKIKGVIKDEDKPYPVTIFTGETVSLNDIKPIPLTEGILDKNSIKISSFTGTLYWFDEDEHCCVKPIEDRFMFMYSKGVDYLTFRITYVHQLQHLLRLVGVQKEIEL